MSACYNRIIIGSKLLFVIYVNLLFNYIEHIINPRPSEYTPWSANALNTEHAVTC